MIRYKRPIVSKQIADKPKKHLNATNLAGIGIGGIIGAGYFLGTGLAVHQAGPSVVLAFLLGGLIMTQVLGAMTSINVNRLARGSFRVYAEQMMGSYAGFLMGWAVLISGILGISSEALAMGIFIQYWIPAVPLSVWAVTFTGLVILLNGFGVQNFSQVESGMAAIKSLALIGFILLGGYMLINHGTTVQPHPLSSWNAFFPHGLAGTLEAMLVVIFTYAGVGAVAMASSEVQNPRKQIPAASNLLSLGIIALYVISMSVLVSIVPWGDVYITQSPFVQALDRVAIGWASTSMNAVILIAAFSVMAASYYAGMEMLISLAVSGKALAYFAKSNGKGVHRGAWIGVGGATLAVVALSFVFPPRLFNYLVSASSFFVFLNWIMNLITFLIWLRRRETHETYVSPLILGRPGAYATLAVIGFLALMSLRVHDFRMGFYAAATLMVIISAGYWLWKKRAERNLT